MKKKTENILKTVLFLAIGLLITAKLTRIYSISNIYSEHAEMMINGYYDLKKDSVDAVLVGNSRIYRGFQPAFAWKEYGIATTDFSTSDMPYGAIKNVAIEALKTQSPKVLVIEASAFAQTDDEKEEAVQMSNNKIYLLLNYMKYSLNYFDMLRNFLNYHRISSKEALNYILPLMQFHSRWEETQEGDFIQTQESYLNSCYQEEFLNKTETRNYRTDTQLCIPINEDAERALRNLLEWCLEQKDTQILLLAGPVIRREEYLGLLNYIGDVISEYDLPYLNYNRQELFDSIGFDTAVDYQDLGHTNVRGSLKFTRVFSQYLIDQYGLENRSKDPSYADWDMITDRYYEIINNSLRK